jgi:hypothetical protein
MEEATGKAAEHWDGLYSRGAGVVTGGLGRAGVRARACSERAPGCQLASNTWKLASAMVQRRISLAKSLCTVASLLHILPFCCDFQVKIWSG